MPPTSQPTPPALQPVQTPKPSAHSQAASVVSPWPPSPCQGSPPLAQPLATDSALGRFLFKHGFDTVTSTVQGWTPLLWAAKSSKTEPEMLAIVQELVKNDSVTSLQLNMGFPGERPRGWTALHMVVDGKVPPETCSQRLELLRVLLMARADPMVWRGKNMCGPYMLSGIWGHVGLVLVIAVWACDSDWRCAGAQPQGRKRIARRRWHGFGQLGQGAPRD